MKAYYFPALDRDRKDINLRKAIIAFGYWILIESLLFTQIVSAAFHSIVVQREIGMAEYEETTYLELEKIANTPEFKERNLSVLNQPSGSLTITKPPISQADCYGNQVKFSVIIVDAIGTVTYQWQQMPPGGSYSNIAGANSNILIIDNIGVNNQNTNGTQYRVIVSDCCNTLISTSATLTINEITGIQPKKTQTTVCEGGSFSFTVNTSGLSPISYQWLKNGYSIIDGSTNGVTYSGATSSTLTVTNASVGESGSYQVQIVFNVIDGVTTDKTCQITSELIRHVTVNPNHLVSITIETSANHQCAGTSILYTATVVNGGSTPEYQWLVNEGNAGTNNASFTYTPSNGDVIACKIISNAVCPAGNPATSNTITMTVIPYLPQNPIIHN